MLASPRKILRTILSYTNCDIEVLKNRKTIGDVIDDKINERNSEGNEVPFCVANVDDVFKKHLQWQSLLPRVTPFYAVKCNNTPAIIWTLSSLGTGFDCASAREMEMVMSFGVTPDRIIYAHTTKPQSHIKYARAHGVDMMTFDCEEELLKIYSCHPKAKLMLRIAVDDSKSQIKLNTKFGAKLHTVGALLELAQELHLDVTGVSFHVGSMCTDSEPYKMAIADARQVFDYAKSMGFHMSLLDIGGGFSGKKGNPVSFQEISKTINEALDEYFPADSGVRIIAEPGCYFVDTSFTLAANILAKKAVLCDPEQNKENGKDFGKIMTYYISEGVYGTMRDQIYGSATYVVSPHSQRVVESSEPRYQSVICGPTSDSVDKLTNNMWMPELNVGEWVLVHDIGAYSISLACEFNGFEKAQIYPIVTAETWDILSEYCNKSEK